MVLCRNDPTNQFKPFHQSRHQALTAYCPNIYILDNFQDFLIAEHMKPGMHILEISISSLNHVFIRPTKTPKLADKKCAQF